MERVIFLFIDGCGVGRASPANPFFLAKSRFLPFWQGGMRLPDGTPLTAIDATLGIPGAPQSASGQTALFCGASAPDVEWRHRNGYPDRRLREIIFKRNIISRLGQQGVRARYLNAYPAHDQLFTAKHVRIEPNGHLWFSPEFPEQFRRMISVTSCMLLTSGQKPFAARDILAGNALYQDYSNRQLNEEGLSLPEFSPAQAAEVLRGASRFFDFILYEYFQTDLYAHRKTLEECVALIRDLDTLIGTLQASLDKKRDTLVLTSDHGNLEDYPERGHSRNPVPLIAWGRHGARLRKKIKNISDVTPAIIELYGRRAGKDSLSSLQCPHGDNDEKIRALATDRRLPPGRDLRSCRREAAAGERLSAPAAGNLAGL